MSLHEPSRSPKKHLGHDTLTDPLPAAGNDIPRPPVLYGSRVDRPVEARNTFHREYELLNVMLSKAKHRAAHTARFLAALGMTKCNVSHCE